MNSTIPDSTIRLVLRLALIKLRKRIEAQPQISLAGVLHTIDQVIKENQQ